MENTNDEEHGTLEQRAEELTVEQKLANLFFDLYKGLDRAYGSYKITNTKSESDKVQGRAKTEIGPYDVKLWNKHLNGNEGLGVVPIQDDGKCWWGAIDIDVYPLDLTALEKKVHKLGLPLIVIRTKSGGAHLTVFFKEPVSCKLVRGKLYEFALVLGYGGVEIFPKQVMLASSTDIGNWLNMPYFEHLNTSRYAIFKGVPISAEQFIMLAHKLRITGEILEGISVSVEGDFADGPPCLQMIMRNGAPEGTRNSTLFAMGVYAKKKCGDDWEDKIEGMNSSHISPPLKSKEVQIIIKSLGRKEYFYPCNKAPLISSCNKDLCRKRPFGIGQDNAEFNLSLGSLLKIDTEPPVWIMDVEGVRIQLDTEDLMMQERFRKACMMSVNKLPTLIKRGEWENILREKLETVEIVEAPVESKLGGRINQYAFQYLSCTPPARVRDEILLGRPYFDKQNNQICFRGNDLIRYLENNGIRAEGRKIWASLRGAGIEHGVYKIKNTVHQVWKVPKDMVPELVYDLPPDIDEDF